MRAVTHIRSKHRIANCTRPVFLLIELKYSLRRKPFPAFGAGVPGCRFRIAAVTAHFNLFHRPRTITELIWICQSSLTTLLHSFHLFQNVFPNPFLHNTNRSLFRFYASFFPYLSLFLHLLQNTSPSRTFSPQCGQYDGSSSHGEQSTHSSVSTL